MLVYNAMTRGAECIPPDATLRDAAKRMKALDVGSLPVCENDRLIGVVTDRDIAVRSVAEGNDPRFDRVRDTMTPRVVYCYDDEDVEAAAELMRAEQVRRLPVLNRDMRLVGILSLGDLAIETDDEQLAGHALEGISEPAEPRR
jgi:CBS domain-containing protein